MADYRKMFTNENSASGPSKFGNQEEFFQLEPRERDAPTDFSDVIFITATDTFEQSLDAQTFDDARDLPG